MTAACCWALVSVPGARAAAIDQQVAADPHGIVEIADTEGVITCSGWDQAQVAVRGELGPGAERVDVERVGIRKGSHQVHLSRRDLGGPVEPGCP